MYLTYSLLSLVLFVVVSPYFVYQALRYKKYIGTLRQRLGFLPITFNIDAEESIWIHAVSVGEALTARALAADLKARYPRLRLFLSTTTIAGQQIARRSLSEVDAVFYFPFDWTFIDRDLAEPAARVPASRREDGDDQRPPLPAVVPAIPHDSSVLQPSAR
jgi:3-deoxy-D-manno-octulosonic-acid transferase